MQQARSVLELSMLFFRVLGIASLIALGFGLVVLTGVFASLNMGQITAIRFISVGFGGIVVSFAVFPLHAVALEMLTLVERIGALLSPEQPKLKADPYNGPAKTPEETMREVEALRRKAK